MRIIGHLDMDAFFAAVEERDKEWLRGLPIVVGADPMEGKGRGVVSTANYKAREYGIRSAMPISTAWRLSEEAKRRHHPPAIFVGTNPERYAEVSDNIKAIVRRYAPSTEEASIDEMYLDLTFTGSYAAAEEICRKVKGEIKEKEGLTGSVGIGPSKLIAKIASDMQKPDGLTLVKEEEAEKFLEPLPVRKIPGIGPKTEEFFNKKGIFRVHDLKKFSKEEMRDMLGRWGTEFYDKIRGVDDSPVEENWEVKSVGEQETFMQDTRDPNFILERIGAMCERVRERFLESGFKNFRTVSVTVRFSDFETKDRSRTLGAPAGNLNILHFEALKLLMPFLDKRENPRGKLLRLVGVRVEKLS